MNKNNAEALQRLWREGQNSASFSGENYFKRNTGATRAILRQQVFPHLITYQKFRVAKRPKVYNPYFVRTRRKVLQSDIIFMDQPQSMSRVNKGHKYILIVQDIFTRKIWAQALQTKSGKEVGGKLKAILEEMTPFHKDARLVIDRGTEYLNTGVKNMLKDLKISITHPSDGHASHVERANLSLQRILFQKMTEQGSRKWLEFLPKAVSIMNERHHRIIKMSAEEAEEEENRDKVNEAMALYRQKAFDKQVKVKGKVKFSVGDMVRIQRGKRIFNRGYQPTFSSEVFKITEVLKHLPVVMYKISEWDGSKIEGNFYPEELTLVKGDVFKVEKIIRRAIRGGVPSALVKWEGFDKKYNSWVPVRDISSS